jgi:hypothetical protein
LGAFVTQLAPAQFHRQLPHDDPTLRLVDVAAAKGKPLAQARA